MHLLYVDESGDTGGLSSPTRTFTLSALLVHHAEWHATQGAITAMRRRLQEKYGYPHQAEIHASEMLGRSDLHHGTKRHQRIQSVLHAVEMVRREKRLIPLRVIVDKGSTSSDTARLAWLRLLDATSKQINSSDGHRLCSAQGLAVVCDDHRTAPSAAWLGEVRAKLDLGDLLIDEPFGRDSRQSPLLQLCDLLAYLTKQSHDPNSLFRHPHSQPMLKRCETMFREKGVTIFTKEEGGALTPP